MHMPMPAHAHAHAHARSPARPHARTHRYDQIAQFLTSQGFKEQALQVATDPDLKFELAIELGRLELAHSIILGLPEAERNTTPTQHKWKQLGDLALASCNLALAAKCSQASGDLAGQLIMLSSSGDHAGLLQLGEDAKARGLSLIHI